MRVVSRSIAIAAIAAFALGCNNGPKTAPIEAAPQPVTMRVSGQQDTGGSAKGDFGPPRGDPIRAILTDAPEVPPPTNRNYPAKVIVELEVIEQEMEIADGVTYTFWTFGGKVPGKFIRVRQGDTVEFHLLNHPSSKMPHNIDLHAVTGPGGGAEASFTAPGHRTQFTFKALNQGLFVYHCATAPVGLHIANGMYGLILVEPPEGLEPVDREYYVMQGDYYTTGKYGEKGLQPFDQEKAILEQPTYVLFNGREGAVTGDNALKANVGETVRLFLGNGGPNLISSFHVIGEIFDRLYSEGGTRYQENVQTTLLPAGGAAVAEYKVEVPGTYALVDHSIFRAFHKGAIGQMKVDGPEVESVFSGQELNVPYTPGESLLPVKAIETTPAAMPAAPAAAPEAKSNKKASLSEQMAAGQKSYASYCQSCHMAEGQGMPSVFPPLAKSDYLMKDKLRAVSNVVHGLSGPITVNGQNYNSMMPPQGYLDDATIANVLTFVRNSFGNEGEAVTVEEVAKIRKEGIRMAVQ